MMEDCFELFTLLHIMYFYVCSTLLLNFLLCCLFFTVLIVYCYIELSFGCCDTQTSPFGRLIKEF